MFMGTYINGNYGYIESDGEENFCLMKLRLFLFV